MIEVSGMMDMMGAWMWLWGAVALAVIVLIAVLVARLLSGGPAPEQLSVGNAERELRRRYATGEIGHDEFLERTAILRREAE